ncbi:hypothetical protein B296_00030510 [Ensete ventricosum]|uniref:Uncharacterized protein n=1 Tax=Ensete ventricosum TaxID=4639 RepID=A0A427ADY2_ENSVE|nr:hypothetical protein B296_00030510 [Ensete ventricosum]
MPLSCLPLYSFAAINCSRPQLSSFSPSVLFLSHATPQPCLAATLQSAPCAATYCTNFYYEEPSETAGVCYRCLSERYQLPHKKSAGRDTIQPAAGRRTASAKGDGFKQSSRGGEESESHGRSGRSAPATKPTGRRYKLLKDVLY